MGLWFEFESWVVSVRAVSSDRCLNELLHSIENRISKFYPKFRCFLFVETVMC